MVKVFRTLQLFNLPQVTRLTKTMAHSAVVYIMDMKLSHVRGHFSMITLHGDTSMVQFLKNEFLKPLGPSLEVN